MYALSLTSNSNKSNSYASIQAFYPGAKEISFQISTFPLNF